MGLILNRKQLGEALGVSDSAIGDWEHRGCPTVRRGRGRGSKSLYDFDAVRAWCDENGRACGLNALASRKIALPGATPASAHVCTGPDAHTLARLIALARVDFLQSAQVDTWNTPPNELADLVYGYTFALAVRLERAGFRDPYILLDRVERTECFPTTFEGVVARARAEIP